MFSLEIISKTQTEMCSATIMTTKHPRFFPSQTSTNLPATYILMFEYEHQLKPALWHPVTKQTWCIAFCIKHHVNTQLSTKESHSLNATLAFYQRQTANQKWNLLAPVLQCVTSHINAAWREIFFFVLWSYVCAGKTSVPLWLPPTVWSQP